MTHRVQWKDDGMSKDFVMVVGKHDAERFRRFRTGEDDDMVRALSNGRHVVNAWALSDASVGAARSKIREGDRVLFAEYGSRFVTCGIVSGMVRDDSAAVSAWGDTPRMRMLEWFVLFSDVREISEPFSRTCRDAGIEASEFTTLHEATRHIGMQPGRPDGSVYETTATRGVLTIPADDDGPPEKSAEMAARFVRNTEKTRRIRKMYRDKCQVCGIVIDVPGGGRYSEVHHLHPLKEDGDDNYGNMIVLCPNHHVEFDYRAMGIFEDGVTIVDRHGREVGKLATVSGHSIDAKNIKYHMEAMRRA